MYLNNLTVQIDNSAANDGRLELALALAGRHEAHLIGCYTVQALNPVVYSSGTALSGVYETALESLERDSVAAETAFRNKATARQADHDWTASEGSVAGNLVLASRYADLCLAGQFNPDDTHGVDPGVAENVAMEAGCPVLIVPYIGASEDSGSRVLVAWNESRESARAVNDALPLLIAADQVDLLYMHHDERRATLPSPSRRLAARLARNGVKASPHDLNISAGEVGDALLSRASDLGSNMIVMGAYGHSRFREMVLGGATHDLLRHMTVPVLMSH